MKSLRRTVSAVAVAALIASCGTANASKDAHHRREPMAPIDPTADVERFRQWNNTVLWNNTATWNFVVAANYAAAIERAHAEEAFRAAVARARAARAAQARPAVASSAPRPVAGPTVTGQCGGATNGADRFIAAESGGRPDARNSSGAWGCYQIMPGTWRGSCSDLGTHGTASTTAQAQCASRLPSSSWAATGG